MSPSLRDARESVTGVFATAFCPINFINKSAKYASARLGDSFSGCQDVKGLCFLKLWRNQ
jgi:hypothetical protein